MSEIASDDRHQCHTDPGDVEAARQWMRDTLTQHGVAFEVQSDLTKAFTEITTKVLPRVDGRPIEDKVEIQLAVDEQSVRMSIVDSSPPFERGSPSDKDHEGGMGLLLLHLLADEVSVGPGPAGGSVTTVVKHRPSS